MDTDKDDPAAENALGGFLRARRARLRPQDVGIPASGRRRVPGLRREEVATLAGVSTDYYMRLEQGRERHPSQQILEAVARALRLDDEAVAHLFRVAGPRNRRTRRAPRVERVAPHMRRLLDTWSGTPAFVLGPALDILARNRLASALHAGFTHSDNLLRMTLLDPAARHFYLDWDRAAESTVAALRRSAGIDPDDARLSQLVGELSMKSPDFRVLWARQDVRGKTREAKLFHHAQVGDLELHYESFTVNSAPTQQLVVYQAEPGSTSADALALLGSLIAGPVPAPDTATGVLSD
ncbi:helix-turn-helix transcriptional regulator [Streptomyces sp. TLI_185]|uniref:helix-turn-helix transcriptional regulator n=1 Tax=Streptomyces sp. TLI_185 TaxID=2485151 RepID=UPI000F4DE287|nr:helix-turn-helix transcriptional regulator [Streptomyces sp. TLI_185]RPF39158.1 helix-turn-helix protein [Streptomyces sp. TLI_185]